jgi:hypothetical protein
MGDSCAPPPSRKRPLGEVARNTLFSSSCRWAWATRWHWCPSTMAATRSRRALRPVTVCQGLHCDGLLAVLCGGDSAGRCQQAARILVAQLQADAAGVRMHMNTHGATPRFICIDDRAGV